MISAWSSAFIAAIVGFGGTIALLVQALQALGASDGQLMSAITTLCIGIGGLGMVLSFWLRMPVVLAWSTPGAALLAASASVSASGLNWPIAIGIFISAGALMLLVGVVPMLGRLAAAIPSSVASAMLAGVLLPFCLGLFRAMESDALFVIILLTIFLLGRQLVPLYAMLLVLAAGIGMLLLRGQLALAPGGPVLGHIELVMPVFDPAMIASVAVPLFLVTLVSQNLPGLVVLRTSGYAAPSRPLIAGTGLATMLLAPLGAYAVNLAAITAAICTGEDAHPDKQKRWVVGVIYGFFYLLLALFAPMLVRLFISMPSAAIAALTGLALIVPLTGAMEHMLANKGERDAAIITFAATASGITLFGVGAAFWGLTAGFAALGTKRLVGRLKC
ncbi:MAG: benzoate/H(+) symporter BenE family transporter [Sphingobium sp.]|nr:benzoate/H(+) symporter BenE family transporter [Sphingobium sp.]